MELKCAKRAQPQMRRRSEGKLPKTRPHRVARASERLHYNETEACFSMYHRRGQKRLNGCGSRSRA